MVDTESDKTEDTGPGRQSDGVSSFTDSSPFVELLGTKTRVEIIDALLRNPELELSASEISDLIGRDRSSFHRHKKVLTDLGILKKTKKEGQKQYYQLERSVLSKYLREAQAALVEEGTTVDSIKNAMIEDPDDTNENTQEPSGGAEKTNSLPDGDIGNLARSIRDETSTKVPQ